MYMGVCLKVKFFKAFIEINAINKASIRYHNICLPLKWMSISRKYTYNGSANANKYLKSDHIIHINNILQS